MEDALRASVRQLALASRSPDGQPGSFDETRTAIRAVVEDTLHTVAAEINEKSTTRAVPPELLCHTASFLTLPDRIRVALVCQRWRSIILGAPRLWCTLALDFGSRPALWSAVLKALLSRSHGRALTLEVSFGDYTWTNSGIDAGKQFVDIIRRNMHRIKALSLMFPGFEPGSDHAHWAAVLTATAPVLERLSLYSTDEYPTLPPNFLGNDAPLLRDLYLQYVDLPEAAAPALRGITNLYYDGKDTDAEVLHTIATSMPHLRQLTLMSWLDGAAICVPQELELRVSAAIPPAMLERHFPRASSLCLSIALGHAYIDLALSRAFSAQVKVTSVDVRWTANILEPPWEMNVSGRKLAIQLNTSRVAVDVQLHTLLPRITGAILQQWTRDVQSVVIPEQLWGAFSGARTPHLHDLTLFIEDSSARPSSLSIFTPTTAITRKSLSSLRIARTLLSDDEPDDDEPDDETSQPPVQHTTLAIPADILVQFIQSLSSSGRLQTLILRDFTLVDPGIADLLALVDVIRYEDSCNCTDADIEPWTREFPWFRALKI